MKLHEIRDPLLIVFLDGQKRVRMGVHPVAGFEDARAYAVLLCDAVAHIANAFEVPPQEIWRHVSGERERCAAGSGLCDLSWSPQPGQPMLVQSVLMLVYPGDRDEVYNLIETTEGFGPRQYAQLLCDAVIQVARTFQTTPHGIWVRIDIERQRGHKALRMDADLSLEQALLLWRSRGPEGHS